MNNTFESLGFKEGDVVICTTSTLKAPTDIKNKAFILQSGNGLFLNESGSVLYYGEYATWRKATSNDGDFEIHHLVEDWENGWCFAKPFKKPIFVKDVIKTK